MTAPGARSQRASTTRRPEFNRRDGIVGNPATDRVITRRLVGVVLAALLFGGGGALGSWLVRTGGSAPTAAAAQTAPDFSSAIREVAASVRPAVVQITNQQVQIGQLNQPFAVPAGVGSGVIYDDQGHILTNNHVVAGAAQLLVSLPDGRSLPGTLVGADPQTDLAVVQIHGDNLPVAQLGDSSQLQVGDWVVAIGNALALPGGPTVTQGTVSALGRTVQEPADSNNPQSGAGPFLFDVIQTDAPINPGNSGGPLVNLQGQVVGIDTLVAGQAGPGVQAEGISFAISLAAAKPIADQLVSTGHAVHPLLGVTVVDMSPVIAGQLGVPTNTQGVAVAQVGPGSPAAAAGLQPADVITAVDGQAVTSDTGFAQLLNGHQPGDQISLSIIRDGQPRTVSATLSQRAP